MKLNINGEYSRFFLFVFISLRVITKKDHELKKNQSDKSVPWRNIQKIAGKNMLLSGNLSAVSTWLWGKWARRPSDVLVGGAWSAILEHFNHGFNSGDPCVDGNLCVTKKKKMKQRFYVAASEFKGLEPSSALCNHAYKNKIWSHSKSSRRVSLRV